MASFIKESREKDVQIASLTAEVEFKHKALEEAKLIFEQYVEGVNQKIESLQDKLDAKLVFINSGNEDQRWFQQEKQDTIKELAIKGLKDINVMYMLYVDNELDCDRTAQQMDEIAENTLTEIERFSNVQTQPKKPHQARHGLGEDVVPMDIDSLQKHGRLSEWLDARIELVKSKDAHDEILLIQRLLVGGYFNKSLSKEENQITIGHGEITLFQNKDSTMQLRDTLSRLWCACGAPAITIFKENEPPYKFLCDACSLK